MAADGALLSPKQRYAAGVAAGDWQADAAQENTVQELTRIQQKLVRRQQARWWQRAWWRVRRPRPVRGLYLWGGVGRGKTFLIDLFYDAVPGDAKLRLHFHRFMREVHAELKRVQGQRDPLEAVAQHFAERASLLCLDEFLVVDIGDAMLLSGLLHGLFARGVSLVTTSNLPPQELYKDGLQRAKFLPAIALLERHCKVAHLTSATDYRLRVLTSAPVYMQPPGAAADAELQAMFERIAPGHMHMEGAGDIEINDRPIRFRRRADLEIWFDFAALCDGPRAVADYIELAQAFNTVLISGVPRFSERQDDQARRFVHLIDELYDRNVNLLLSAAAPPHKLYSGDKLTLEFARTSSRLIEMQSAEYLAREHKP